MHISVPNILVGKVEGAAPGARLTQRLILSVDYFGEEYAALALFTSPERARAFLAAHGTLDGNVMLLDSDYLRSCLQHERTAIVAVIDPSDPVAGDAQGFFIQDIMRAFRRAMAPDDVMIIRADTFRLLAG